MDWERKRTEEWKRRPGGEENGEPEVLHTVALSPSSVSDPGWGVGTGSKGEWLHGGAAPHQLAAYGDCGPCGRAGWSSMYLLAGCNTSKGQDILGSTTKSHNDPVGYISAISML